MPNWRGFPPMVRPEPLTAKLGLIRSATGATTPRSRASRSISASSPKDSQMIV
jgi:hypothetical protein